MVKRTCNWIFSKPGEFPVQKCPVAVSFRMERDDDGNYHRVWYSFCLEHTIEAKKQEE